MPNVSRIERALDLWTGTPAISFVDALTATLALDLGADLGTFDRRLTRVPGVTIWQPPGPAAGAAGTSNGTT